MRFKANWIFNFCWVFSTNRLSYDGMHIDQNLIFFMREINNWKVFQYMIRIKGYELIRKSLYCYIKSFIKNSINFEIHLLAFILHISKDWHFLTWKAIRSEVLISNNIGPFFIVCYRSLTHLHVFSNDVSFLVSKFAIISLLHIELIGKIWLLS